MICDECNTKNGKSDKFCRNCGKSLGEVKEEVKTTNFEGILKTALGNIKGVFMNPIDTAKEFIKEENYFTSLIYLSVNVLFLALFVLVLVKAFSGLLAGYISLDYFGGFYEPLELPYFRMFLISIMTGLITYALLAGFAYFFSTLLFKGKTSFKKMCAWLGINSVFYTVLLILVAVSMFISVKLGILVYLIGEILYTYNMFRTFEFSTDTNVNKLGYVLVPTILFTILIVVFVLPKLFF